MTQNKILLQKCLKEIENTLNWVDSSQWQQKHFESLSELIFEKTKVRLSPLTLKRLWGKTKYESNPSASTLGALVQFLDYKDWIDYQSKQSNKVFDIKCRYIKNKKFFISVSIIAGILVLATAIVTLLQQYPSKTYSNFEFSVQKLSASVPNTVYFKYNVKNTDADSVIIQQSWDSALHHLVDKNKTDFSCIYYYPGYYKAKLVLDDSVVSRQDLYVKSNGWLGIVHKNPVPYYVASEDIFDSTSLSIKEEHLIAAGFDLKNEIPYVSLNLVEEFKNIQGNNFELQTVFEQTFPRGEAICQKSELFILCSESLFYIPFSIKGCVNELGMYIPDKSLSAKNTDLRNLGVEGGAVRVNLKVLNGIFNLTVGNNSPIIDTLTINPGKIVGLKFGFQGSGKVFSFKLTSGNTSYSEHDFLP